MTLSTICVMQYTQKYVSLYTVNTFFSSICSLENVSSTSASSLNPVWTQTQLHLDTLQSEFRNSVRMKRWDPICSILKTTKEKNPHRLFPPQMEIPNFLSFNGQKVSAKSGRCCCLVPSSASCLLSFAVIAGTTIYIRIWICCST